MTAVARHRWIEVAAPAHEAVAASAEAAHRETVRRWLARGWPLVARSRQPGEREEGQPAGLSLATDHGKVKVAVRVPSSGIQRVEEPPALRDVASVLPDAAAEVAGELAEQALRHGFVARAFGSAAWQWRTGEPYLHEGSDLDVLAAPPTSAALHAWIEALRHAEARCPMRIDGEIEGADGDAVNWRELAGPAARLLVKSAAGARLAERATLERAWR